MSSKRLNLRLVRNRERRSVMPPNPPSTPPNPTSIPQSELEEMFRVLSAAWENSKTEYVDVRIPAELSHLTWDQWEQAARLLQTLQMQQEFNPRQ